MKNKTYSEFYTKKWNEGDTVFKNQEIDPPKQEMELIEVRCRFETINGKRNLIIPSQL